MQIYTLFALLPLLANAVPLNLGGILPCSGSGCTWTPSTPPTTYPNTGTGTGIDIGAALDAGVVIGNPIPSLTAALAPKITDIKEKVGDVVAVVPEVVADVVSVVQPVVDTASSIVSSLPSKVSEVLEVKESVVAAVPSVVAAVSSKVSAVADVKESVVAAVPSVAAIIPAVVSAVPSIVDNLIPSGEAPSIALPSLAIPSVSLPSVALPSASPALGSPSAALDALSAYLAGLKAPSVVVALVQLGNIISRLQQAVNGQAAALRNRVDLAAIVAYTHAIVKNISNYLNGTPNSVLTNFAVRQLARSIDNLLVSYIYGLQVIGLSTAAFAQQALQLGLSAKGFSSYLPNTCALFPA